MCFLICFRIYFAEDNSLEKTYLDSTKENFLAEPVATDFSKGEVARETINTWVENQTNSKIKDVIAKNVLNDRTKLVLLNAVSIFSCLDHTFPVHLFYQLNMQETCTLPV